MSAVTDEWRVGNHYNIHVYAGEVAVATAMTPEFAAQIVASHNAYVLGASIADARYVVGWTARGELDASYLSGRQRQLREAREATLQDSNMWHRLSGQLSEASINLNAIRTVPAPEMTGETAAHDARYDGNNMPDWIDPSTGKGYSGQDAADRRVAFERIAELEAENAALKAGRRAALAAAGGTK